MPRWELLARQAGKGVVAGLLATGGRAIISRAALARVSWAGWRFLIRRGGQYTSSFACSNGGCFGSGTTLSNARWRVWLSWRSEALTRAPRWDFAPHTSSATRRLLWCTHFVDDWDNNGHAACLVVQDAGNVILDFLLYDIKVIRAHQAARCFLLEVGADHPHQLFIIAQVDEASADDIWAGEEAPRPALDGEHHNEHPLQTHVDAILQHDIAHHCPSVVIHCAARVRNAPDLVRTIGRKLHNIPWVTDKDMAARDTTLLLG